MRNQPKIKLSRNFIVNDIHVHVGPSNDIFKTLPIEKLLEFMKQYDVNEAAVMPFEIQTDLDNQRIIKMSKEHNSIHGLYWIQKHRIEEDLDILRKELSNGLIGIKFHGAFERLPITDSIYTPILELISDTKSIILIHCGRFKDGNPESDTSFEHGLTLAKKFSKIKVVLAHMGGNATSIVKKAVNATKDYHNVFFDTSGISTPYRVEYAVKVIGPDRIIFGSDYPWCSYLGNYYNVEDSLLDEKIIQKIFFDNFQNLVGK